MVNGDGLVQVREINDLLGLPPNTAWELMRRGIFSARKLRTGVYVVPEGAVAVICDRIIRYRGHQPYYPHLNCTIEEAAAALAVTPGAIYGLLKRRELEASPEEHWKCPTRESVRRLARRKGLKEAV